MEDWQDELRIGLCIDPRGGFLSEPDVNGALMLLAYKAEISQVLEAYFNLKGWSEVRDFDGNVRFLANKHRVVAAHLREKRRQYMKSPSTCQDAEWLVALYQLFKDEAVPESPSNASTAVPSTATPSPVSTAPPSPIAIATTPERTTVTPAADAVTTTVAHATIPESDTLTPAADALTTTVPTPESVTLTPAADAITATVATATIPESDVARTPAADAANPLPPTPVPNLLQLHDGMFLFDRLMSDALGDEEPAAAATRVSEPVAVTTVAEQQPVAVTTVAEDQPVAVTTVAEQQPVAVTTVAEQEPVAVTTVAEQQPVARVATVVESAAVPPAINGWQPEHEWLRTAVAMIRENEANELTRLMLRESPMHRERLMLRESPMHRKPAVGIPFPAFYTNYASPTATSAPAISEQAANAPAISEQAADAPAFSEAAGSGPAISEPVVSAPAISEPVLQPFPNQAASAAATIDPAASAPATIEPTRKRPLASAPATIEPAADAAAPTGPPPKDLRIVQTRMNHATMQAYVSLSDTSIRVADTYERGKNGFAKAIWGTGADPWHTSETEFQNALVQEDGTIAHEKELQPPAQKRRRVHYKQAAAGTPGDPAKVARAAAAAEVKEQAAKEKQAKKEAAKVAAEAKEQAANEKQAKKDAAKSADAAADEPPAPTHGADVAAGRSQARGEPKPGKKKAKAAAEDKGDTHAPPGEGKHEPWIEGIASALPREAQCSFKIGSKSYTLGPWEGSPVKVAVWLAQKSFYMTNERR